MASVSRPKEEVAHASHEHAADLLRFTITPFHGPKPSPSQPEDEGWGSGCMEQTENSRAWATAGNVNAAELFADHNLHVGASCSPHLGMLAWAGSCSASMQRHLDFTSGQPAIQNRWELQYLSSLMKEEQ